MSFTFHRFHDTLCDSADTRDKRSAAFDNRTIVLTSDLIRVGFNDTPKVKSFKKEKDRDRFCFNNNMHINNIHSFVVPT